MGRGRLDGRHVARLALTGAALVILGAALASSELQLEVRGGLLAAVFAVLVYLERRPPAGR